MKKTIVFILLGLIACVGIANAQTSINEDNYKNGFIQMNISVIKDNKPLHDTNTLVKVNCLSDKIEFNSYSSCFTLVLHPNKEYNLIFIREGNISKSIYVTTSNVLDNKNYNINVDIRMVNGSSKEYIYAGKIFFDKDKKNFEKKITHVSFNDYEQIKTCNK